MKKFSLFMLVFLINSGIAQSETKVQNENPVLKEICELRSEYQYCINTAPKVTFCFLTYHHRLILISKYHRVSYEEYSPVDEKEFDVFYKIASQDPKVISPYASSNSLTLDKEATRFYQNCKKEDRPEKEKQECVTRFNQDMMKIQGCLNK
ncbi:MAG: hypothetical protein ACR2M7_05140 [Bdellovibrionales bacterium]